MTKHQKRVLIVSILASLVTFLDGSIVNVALPAIQRSLGGGLASQQWIIDAYMLTLGSFILIAGSLSDLLGRKRILGFGLLGFGIASVLCALAPSSLFLIIFRAFQGIAGALLVPSSLALIISAFSGPSQGKAIGSWTAWTGIAFVIGPLLGGFLVDDASWRWIFAINILPIAVTMYLLKNIESAEKTESSHSKVDYLGTLLCALGLGGPVFALIEQPSYGWSDPLIYLTFILGIGLFAAFLLYERKASHPMLPLHLFARRNFSVGNVATLAIYAGLGSSTFLIVVYLQQVNGYSALYAGMSLLPVTIIMFTLSPRMGALAGKLGPRLFMGLGPLVAASGFLLMTRIGSHLDYWTQLLPAVLIFGLGLSITVAPLTSAILGDVPAMQAGIASAVNNAVSRVASLLAVAAVGAVIAAQFNAQLKPSLINVSSSSITKAEQSPLVINPPKPYQQDQRFKIVLTNASVSAFHSGLTTIAAMLAAGGLISFIGIRNKAEN
jgi:EmrB/QacA subfamily drug resistance transporter